MLSCQDVAVAGAVTDSSLTDNPSFFQEYNSGLAIKKHTHLFCLPKDERHLEGMALLSRSVSEDGKHVLGGN